MESLVIYNLRYERICELLDNTENKAFNIKEAFNCTEISSLTFDLPLANPKSDYIINEYLVLFNDEFYKMKTPVVKHDDDGMEYYTVSCSHLSGSLAENTITMEEVLPVNVETLMKRALAYSDRDIPTLGWSIGQITVNKTKLRGMESVEDTPFNILLNIAEKYEGILRFNSVPRTVDLLNMEESNNPVLDLRLSKNLTSVEIEYDTSEMITRMYCFGGQTDDGTDLTIMSVNPTGMAYIENYTYFKDLGYTDADIEAHPELFVKSNVWRETNYYDANDLYRDGLERLKKYAFPVVNISITALDLTGVYDYEYTNIKVGDAVLITDEDLGLSYVCYVTERTIDYEERYNLNLTLTNKIEYSSTLVRLFKRTNTSQTVINNNGTISSNKIDNSNNLFLKTEDLTLNLDNWFADKEFYRCVEDYPELMDGGILYLKYVE